MRIRCWGTFDKNAIIWEPTNRPFPSSLGPLYQNEVKCSVFHIERKFYSNAQKTHFHKRGCALGLILKVRVLELGSGLFVAEITDPKYRK